MINDWRKAVRTPLSYSVTNNTLRIQTQFVSFVSISGIVLLFVLYTFVPHTRVTRHHSIAELDEDHGHYHTSGGVDGETRRAKHSTNSYDYTYPLSLAQHLSDNRIRYRIAVIADLDTNSKSDKQTYVWNSYLLCGFLTYNTEQQNVHILWDRRSITLRSSFSSNGRAMELSDLIVFNGKLYSCDDRTGIIYHITDEIAIPWVILMDGDGNTTKGFKCEWLAVKNQLLYVGGLGKEWTTTTGELLNYDPQWIKTVSTTGQVNHLNWRNNYLALKSSTGIKSPGYIIHESAIWSDIHKKWFFLPRRASIDMYNEIEDERKGTNMVLISNDMFSEIKMKTIGPVVPTRGFSSFKFIPNTNDEVIVALKSEEDNGKIATYITVFTIDGKILLNEQLIANYKYEGIEFI